MFFSCYGKGERKEMNDAERFATEKLKRADDIAVNATILKACRRSVAAETINAN